MFKHLNHGVQVAVIVFAHGPAQTQDFMQRQTAMQEYRSLGYVVVSHGDHARIYRA